MKRSVGLMILGAIVAVAVCFASPSRPGDADKLDGFAAIALEFQINVNDINYHARRFPLDGQKLYNAFVTRRLCVFYDAHRFPPDAFRRGTENMFRAGTPHAEAAARLLAEQGKAAGDTARRLGEGKTLTGVEWTQFAEAFEQFYRARSPLWNTMRNDVLNTLRTEIIGVVEHVLHKQPLPGVSVKINDGRGRQLGRGITNSAGRFHVPITYGIHQVFVNAGVSDEDEESMSGLMPFGRRVSFRNSSNSHILPLSHIGDVGSVYATATDAATRLPAPGARVTVVQDLFEQKLAPVTEGVLDREAAEDVLYGGQQTFTTDEFGNVRFQIYAGANTLRVERDGYPPRTLAVAVGGGDESKRLWIQLHKNHIPITLSVRDAKGNAMRFARVHMEGEGNLLADEQGKIFTSAAGGGKPTAFRLDMPGYESSLTEIVPDGDSAEGTLVATPVIMTIMGHARDTAGRPVKGAMAFSITTGDIGAANEEGEFRVSMIPEKDAVIFVGKEGHLTQAVRPYLGAYWVMNQKIFYTGDVTLLSDAEAAPRIEAPSEGAYVAPGALAFDVRFPMHSGRTWGNGTLTVGGQKAEIPFDQQLRYTWKQPLSEGEHEAAIEIALTDKESGQSRVLRSTRKFRVGQPPWLERVETVAGGPTGQRLKVTLRKAGTPASILETARVFVSGQLLVYSREETDKHVVLTADAPPVAVGVRISAYDENGQLVEFFR